MAEYIERQALRNAHIYLNEEGVAVIEIEDIPAADVVSKAAYDQVAWERHLAEVQLKSIGKSLGEKMDDVQPVAHCKDCVYRPYYEPSDSKSVSDLVFPDYRFNPCPCRVEDIWYSWMPDDDWFCAYGKRMDDKP